MFSTRVLLIGLILLGWFLAACTTGLPELSASQITPTLLSLTPQQLPSSTRTVQPTVTQTSAPEPDLPFITSTVVFTAPAAQLCTPIQDHPLEALLTLVSDPYNPPPPGKDARHMGVDFSYYTWEGRTGIAGAAVQAVLPGVVVAVLENHIPYGYTVIVETPLAEIPSNWLAGLDYKPGESLYLLYAHMLEPALVNLADRVTCGQQLGLVGQTGGENTPYALPHLHLEARFGPGGAIFTDMGYYDTRVSEEAREQYLDWRIGGDYRHFDPLILIRNYLYSDSTPNN
jgi:murein DD-endopeptidase MepM/ murein hydrolase activator NlpD